LTDLNSERLAQLQDKTARVDYAGNYATAVFVAPGIALTCAHVFRNYTPDSVLQVTWRGATRSAVLQEQFIDWDSPNRWPDLALIKVDIPEEDYTVLHFADEYAVGDQLLAVGYSEKSPYGETVLCTVEGDSRVGNDQLLLKFRGAQIRAGFSGAPLFNLQTNAVVGIIKSTRDPDSDLGGLAIPTSVIRSFVPLIATMEMYVGSIHEGPFGRPFIEEIETPEPVAIVSTVPVNDVPSHTDRLGFSPYVRAVAAFLTDSATKPPLTLSVEGQWGAGKSSFMNQLQQTLNKAGHRTISFNAWRHDKSESLWAAFALQFIATLTGYSSWPKRLMLNLLIVFRRFDWRKGWARAVQLAVLSIIFAMVTLRLVIYASTNGAAPVVDALLPHKTAVSHNSATLSDNKSLPPDDLATILIQIGGIVGYLVLVALLARSLKEVFGNPLAINLQRYVRDPQYDGHVEFIEHFHQDFAELFRTYNGGNKTIYVFIDDLDRCEIPKAADLVQALNLMLSSDAAPMIFIIGIDRDMVAAGIAAKYEKILPYIYPDTAESQNTKTVAEKGLEYGYNFVEKFIQLPFQLPQPSDIDIASLLSPIQSSGPGDATFYNHDGSIKIDEGDRSRSGDDLAGCGKSRVFAMRQSCQRV
jgi:hypothetical protein